MHNGGTILGGEMKYEEWPGRGAEGGVVLRGRRQSVTLWPLIWYLMHTEQRGYERKCGKKCQRRFLIGIGAAAVRALAGGTEEFSRSLPTTELRLNGRRIGSTPVIVTNELLLRKEGGRWRKRRGRRRIQLNPRLSPATPNSWSETTGFIIENNCRASQVKKKVKKEIAIGR